MKKKLLVLFLVIAMILTIGIVAIAADGEETEVETITISYMKEQNAASTTTTLDTTAYENGKQTVGKGEKFTLPTTANSTYVGQEGFQLVWYTENGRTYKGGETVSFDKDTKLFRCVAKECYTMAEVNYAMTNESASAILMADMSAQSGISVWGQSHSVLILNGFTLNLTKNGTIMGAQRSGKHIYGEGTINITNTDGKKGEYGVFNDSSHSYNGHLNVTVIGVDVTINAPNFVLAIDGDSATSTHYPYTKVYGKVNCYNICKVTNTNNRGPYFEFFEGCQVTINSDTLVSNIDATKKQSIDIIIFGGTFNLPAAASEVGFWLVDDPEADYITKDNISIFGGNFITADGSTPAISSFLGKQLYYVYTTSGNGLYKNENDTTMKPYYYDVKTETWNKDAYVFKFLKASTASDVAVDGITERRRTGTVVVTDNMDGSATGEYVYNVVYNKDSWAVLSFSMTNADGTEITDFTFVTGLSNFAFTTKDVVVNMSSAEFEVDSQIYTTVVPAGCEHNYTGAPVDANCEHSAYADYNCSKCAHNVYFSWGAKLDHNYIITNHVQATLTNLGSKSLSCSYCGDAKERIYSIDPTSLEIPVTIKNDDGTFEEITVLAGEIFNFDTSGADGDYIYTLSGIKKFDTYNIRNIYGVTIPQGIFYINVTTHNEEKYNNAYLGLVELNIADGVTTNILNIGNLRKVEVITIGENANVMFASGCSYYNPNNERRNMQKIATIDLSAGNHNVEFVGSSFSERTTIVNLLLGENANYKFGAYSFNKCAITDLNLSASSTYEFEKYSFYGNKITKIVFPDNIDIEFGNSVFENCTSLASVTFGTGAKYTLGSYCFLYCPIEKVTLTGGSDYSIGQQAFINTALTELDMSEGDMNVTFEKNAFNCYLSNKVYCTLTKVTFGENSTYVLNEGTLTDASITSIVLAKNSEYTFKYKCANGGTNKTNLTTIDASADNISVVFESEAFRERAALTTLLINGKNSTYYFTSSAFYTTPIKEITLGENSTYTFNNAFNGTSSLTKVDASASGVNVTVNNYGFGKSTLTTLLINGKNGTYTFNKEAFRDSKFTELVLGEGSTYHFNDSCYSSTNNLKKIDASASNITATFANGVFSGKSTIEYLDFSGKNSTFTFGDNAFNETNPTNNIVFSSSSTYQFGTRAFRYADFATITFEDNCNVTFTGTEAFASNEKAKSLYIGKNIAITNYPFKNFKALETLYIMQGVTHVNEYEFENAGSSDFSTPLYVYNHSTDLAFTKGMFKNCDGIILYTATNNIGTRTDVFDSCSDGTGYKAWTVYLGISGPLVEGEIAPSCEEYGYETYVCNCGYDCGFYLTETTNVNKYEKKHNITDSTEYAEQTTYEVTPIDPAGHDTLGTLLDVVYSSFIEKGTGTYICSACGKTHTVENAVDAIFEWLGYSTNAEKNEFAIGYRINHEALEQYEALSGNKLVFGVVGAITEHLGGLAPFDEALDPSVKKVSLEIPRENEAGEIAEICFRIQGFKETQMDLGITMAGYVTKTTTDEEGNESSTTVYIQSTQTDNPSSNSINNYLASLPTNEEDEVA